MSLLSLPTAESRAWPAKGPAGDARSKMIGVLGFDTNPCGNATVLSGIQRAAREADRCVSIVSLAAAGSRAVVGALKRLRRLEVEGILALAPPRPAVSLLAELSGELPVVVVGAAPQDVLPAVTSDHYAGAVAATRHLLELGHRSVVHIAGPREESGPSSRLAGWRDALLAAGAEVPAAMIGDGTPAGGYELGRRLGPGSDVTAIFVGSDLMALGVLRALSESRTPVPEEVSVVGFGDVPEAEFFHPPLTTVRQDLAELGRRGVELLQGEPEAGQFGPVQEMIPAELVLRASTGPPA